MKQKLILSVLAFVMTAASQACSKPTGVEHSGGMTQKMEIGLDPNLSTTIGSIFDAILGRKPTTREVRQYTSMSTSPNFEQDLRVELAGSPEARQCVESLLEKYFGYASPYLTDAWIQLLADGHSLTDIGADIRHQFSF